MQPWNRRRRHLVRGRLRVPFEGYQRRLAVTKPDGDAVSASYPVSIFGPEHGLTPAEAWQAEQLLARAQRERGQLEGPRLAARIAGIVSALANGRVGDSAWGWSMHGKRGGQAMARHGLHRLREISPLRARASVIARERRKARGAFERDRAATAEVVPQVVNLAVCPELSPPSRQAQQ
jgi:hypothetical protein